MPDTADNEPTVVDLRYLSATLAAAERVSPQYAEDVFDAIKEHVFGTDGLDLHATPEETP